MNKIESAESKLSSMDHLFNVKIKVPAGRSPETVIAAIRRMVDVQFSTESDEIISTTVACEQLRALDDAIFKYGLEYVAANSTSAVFRK